MSIVNFLSKLHRFLSQEVGKKVKVSELTDWLVEILRMLFESKRNKDWSSQSGNELIQTKMIINEMGWDYKLRKLMK